ncbi:MAG: Cache 3/Cache 2 fusion domain-containing protein [Bacteroidetes bacterium]|nr:Cache 3/Cache 2 fusion domain-containing protein [Bacteroidota bacterium]
MGRFKSIIPLKLRLFFPIAFIIIFIIAVATLLFINSSIKTFNLQIENNLELEVKTITKMFERERQLKLEKVKTNLKVAHSLFYNETFKITGDKISVHAINQENGSVHNALINKWLLNGELLNNNFVFVDSIKNLLGGTATIFQKIDSGYIRVSTNVQNADGVRAVNSYIPNSSPVVQAIEKGETYFGRAFVVNDWYITAYEPIVIKNQIVGILYVGDREKDLPKLREILYSLKIGKTGYPFVFDRSGLMLIHPSIEGENWKDSTLFVKSQDPNQKIIRYNFLGKEKIAAKNYYEDFEIYILASIEAERENGNFIRNTILTSSLIAIIIIIILLSFLYFLTADRIYKYFVQLDISNKKLIYAREALKQSEDRFQKLFNSTGDDIFVTDTNENIVEVNQASCNTLGYTREELLSKKMSEIKSQKYATLVSENRKKIYELGTYTFESEHMAKDGKIIPVEATSRVLDYNNEKLILSVVRNIGTRKETEREILSTVIRTEERERERFAKDMHDSVGPLLSTIKLYVNELKSPNLETEERTDFVNQTNEILDEAIISIRTISNNLMPRVIHKYGLIKALESFCDKVNKTNKINIQLESKHISDRLDQNLELILFRVITELITNTLKHANAKNINIELEKSRNKIIMSFKDDGIGFDIDKIMNSEHLGMGLKNIISRIKSINGDYHFISFPDNGFQIRVNIDL